METPNNPFAFSNTNTNTNTNPDVNKNTDGMQQQMDGAQQQPVTQTKPYDFTYG